MKSYVSSRINKLLSFDVIRKLKILELFQYNFIGFFIVLSISYFLEKLYFSKTYKHFYDKHNSSKNKKLDKSKTIKVNPQISNIPLYARMFGLADQFAKDNKDLTKEITVVIEQHIDE